MANVDLQPILNLLAKSGEETSEFKKARAAGRAATIVWVLSALILVASAVADAMGRDSKVGVIAGAIGSVLGVMSHAMISMGYSSSRAETKTAAAEMAANLAAAQPAQKP